MQKPPKFALSTTAKSNTLPTGSPQGYVYFYEPKYIISAIHYALAINLNKYHQTMTLKGLFAPKVQKTTQHAIKEQSNSMAAETSNTVNIINSNQGLVQNYSQNHKEAIKNLRKTQIDEGDSQNLQNHLSTKKLHLIGKLASLDSLYSVGNSKIKVSRSQTKQTEMQGQVDEELPLSAFIPPMGLPRQQLLSRAMSLLARRMDAWPCKIRKNRGNREINSLKS